MDDSFLWYITKRCVFWVAVVVAFCLLPGPRRIVMAGMSHLQTPQSQESLWAGFQLSLIHFCWLLDIEPQLLPYAESVDPLLANSALLFGILLQIGLAAAAWAASRYVFTYYDPERPTNDMADLEEEFSVEPPRALRINQDD